MLLGFQKSRNEQELLGDEASDVYFSADVETDGPIPGPYSILSVAIVYAGSIGSIPMLVALSLYLLRIRSVLIGLGYIGTSSSFVNSDHHSIIHVALT
jgi:hypothetical protein